jgi:hypothetical protein
MNIISSISSYLNNVKQPPAGSFKRVWSLHATNPTDCIEVVVFDDGDVLVNHLILDPRTRATQTREYITDGDVDPETIKEVIADIRAFINTDIICP